jgi:hypothetical protein
VPERVRGDALREACALGGAADDPGEDRRLQPLALEPAEDGIAGRRPPLVAKLLQLLGELRSKRLAAGLGALALADEQRRSPAFEVDVAPVERDRTGAGSSGRARALRAGRAPAVDDPLERALAEPEVAPDRRQGDVDDRVVDSRPSPRREPAPK